MTVTETLPIDPAVGYGLYDADEHYYEPVDAVTRHLDHAFRKAVQWVELNGRPRILVGDKLMTLIPNPNYDPVGRPGSLEQYFRAENHEGRPLNQIIGEMQALQPEYHDRDSRLKVMDAQGVHFTWLLPSLGLGLEEMLKHDPVALNGVLQSYNRWLDEDWGYDRDGRIQTGPLLSLIDPAAAETELKRVIELGARFITLRPAPVDDPGRPRALGDPAHDRVWAMCAEAGVLVVFHAADSGYSRYTAAWGEGGQYTGTKMTPFAEILSIHIERPIFDTMASMIGHGVFDRHPTLKVATVELGGAWVPDLFRRFKSTYGKMPQVFKRDPIDTFLEHVWVSPFYEDDVAKITGLLGADRVMFGSDWPHPEGLPTPGAWLAELAGFTPEDQKKIMRGTLRDLVGR